MYLTTAYIILAIECMDYIHFITRMLTGFLVNFKSFASAPLISFITIDCYQFIIWSTF